MVKVDGLGWRGGDVKEASTKVEREREGAVSERAAQEQRV
jgi:hypothetical protein